ncbi:MAG TPA: hypothetical protein VIS31_09135 [Woeseiaceae bacterium]
MKSLSISARRAWACALLCIVTMLPGLAAAQVPAAIEGRIESITINDDGSVNMTVMGVDVIVPASVFGLLNADGTVAEPSLATTPTASIYDPNQLLGDPLPGRNDAGFLNGTAIINGASTTTAVLDFAGNITSLTPGFVAADLFVEPAENVVLGSLQRGGTCTLYMEGIPLNFIEDARMAAGMPINGSGFEVDPCGIPENGAAGAVEGYYGFDGQLYIFAFESDDAPIVQNETGGTTTVTRASCDGRRIEVRGSSTLAEGEARLFAPDNTEAGESQIGSAALTLDPVTNTSTYRIRVNIGVCPDEVRVESWTLNNVLDSSATGPVDLR